MSASARTQARCVALCKEMLLPDTFNNIVRHIYMPLSQLIIEKKQSGPLLVSINGAQGTGKSTLTAFLKLIIESEYKLQVAAFSLDDCYYTHAERKQLGKEVHPLLVTRGVPGTHDIELIENVLDTLLTGGQSAVPVFNKAIDDRRPASEWTLYKASIDIILFEGWCNHSPVQDREGLSAPINELEKYEDAQGVWRHYVNEKLSEYHQRLFKHADMCIMLKAPDFEHVYIWRRLQEQKLKLASRGSQQTSIMNDVELKRFIQHYERISRHTLKHLPGLADLLLPVNIDHSIDRIVSLNDNF